MSSKPTNSLQEALDAYLSAATPPARPVTPMTPLPPPASPPVSPAPAPATNASAGVAGPGATPSPASDPPPTGNPTEAGKEELLAAYHRLVEHEANKPTVPLVAPAPFWKKLVVPVIGVASLIANVYLWIARPAWLYPRVDPVAAPVTQLEAEQQLIAASILVEQYHRETGQLPVDFNAMGLDVGHLGISAEANGGYRIVGGTAAQPMIAHGVPGQRIVVEAFPR